MAVLMKSLQYGLVDDALFKTANPQLFFDLVLQFKHCLDEDWGTDIRHVSIATLELLFRVHPMN